MERSLAKTFLALGIAVIFTAFIAYGLYVLYEPPKQVYFDELSNCDKIYNCADQIDACYAEAGTDAAKQRECVNLHKTPALVTCQENLRKCNEKEAKDRVLKSPAYIHKRNSFYILIIISIGAIVGGLFLSHMEGIGSGFIGGGVMLVIYSLFYTAQYWLSFGRPVKLIALGLVLAALVYFGYKKLEKKEEPQVPQAQ